MNNIESIKKTIHNAEAILITAGAGMGVDSGLPDFRGNEGFWKEYPVIKHLGLSFSQMANPDWFESDPKLAWAFYGHRLQLYRDTIPHDGFKLLLDLVKQKNENYFIFTSNVDGQFQKAGFDEDKIIECHGSIHHLQCLDNCTNDIWENKESVPIDKQTFQAKYLPKCKYCNTLARPNILMFGDWGWNSDRESAQENRYSQFLVKNKEKNLVIIELGAGTAVPTVRMEGESISSRFPHATLIRINPRESNLGRAKGFSLEFGGLEGLSKILL